MIFSLLRFSALIILFQQIISPRCKRSCLRLVKKLTGEFMRVSELHFLIEYKILKGFVCWCRERVQLKYGARARTWIWLDKFTRYVRIKFGPKCNKVLNVRTFGPKCNKPPMESFICVRALSFIADIHTEMLKRQRFTKESFDRYLWHIAGSLMLISVFLFSREVGREALATNPYTDVPLASNWQKSK